MTIDVYFHEPNREGDYHAPEFLERIINEIRHAKRYVCIASAWLRDRDVTTAIIDNHDIMVVGLLNRSDVDDTSRNDAIDALIDGNGTSRFYSPYITIMGDNSSMMHHKWIVIDDVVWFGSYNFTIAARFNYEVMLRIPDKALAVKLYDYAMAEFTEETTEMSDAREIERQEAFLRQDFNRLIANLLG